MTALEILIWHDADAAALGATRATVAADGSQQLRVTEVAAGDLARAVNDTDARFVMPLAAGVRFSPLGLRDLTELAASTDSGIAYTDHASGIAPDQVAHFKPAWSPDRLRSHDYLGPAVMFGSDALRAAGGFGAAAPAEARIDAVWRIVEAGATVAHLPHITMVSDDVASAADHLAATIAHAERVGFPGDCAIDAATGATRITPRLPAEPYVSIIMPTAGATADVQGASRCLAVEAVRSITAETAYDNYEVLAVIDAASPDGLAAQLTALGARTIENDSPFNFSGACNLGVSYSRGEIIVLLNDDTEVLDGDWLARLVMHLHDPDVGAVGPKLLYEDGTVQHAGLLGRHGTIRHRYLGAGPDEPGYGGYLRNVVTVGAATGACLAVRLEDYLDVGGLHLGFPRNYNDVDLCMKLRMHGKRIVVDNHTSMRHLESKTRTPSMHAWEDVAAQARWEQWLRFDPYDNPGFELDGFDDAPVPVDEHLEALRHDMRQPVRVLPSAARTPATTVIVEA